MGETFRYLKFGLILRDSISVLCISPDVLNPGIIYINILKIIINGSHLLVIHHLCDLFKLAVLAEYIPSYISPIKLGVSETLRILCYIFF